MPPKPDPEPPADDSADPAEGNGVAASRARGDAAPVEARSEEELAEEELAAQESPDPRSREWSRPWMGTFLHALRAVPNLTAAAQQAGISRKAAWEARKRDAVFDSACREALEESVDNLEVFAIRMSSTGLETIESRTTTKTLTSADGKKVTVEETTVTTRSRLVSPQMAMFMLSAHRPEKYRRPQRFEHTGPDGNPIEVTETEREAAVGAFDATVVRLADRRRAAGGAGGS